MTKPSLLADRGLAPCFMIGCPGNILWLKIYERSIAGKCNQCAAEFTTVITRMPGEDDKEAG